MVEAKVLAAMAARWFDAAGFNIAFSCLPSDIAREGASASAGFLAAAVELRDLLAQSQQGRHALRDLGFEPAPQPLPASQGDEPEVLDIPDQCPYYGPSPHRDVWLAGWYAARNQARSKP